jgi:hypothetical protein
MKLEEAKIDRSLEPPKWQSVGSNCGRKEIFHSGPKDADLGVN